MAHKRKAHIRYMGSRNQVKETKEKRKEEKKENKRIE